MGKFSLSLPGRTKKAPQPVYPSENLSKAHKILGSSQLSIDATGKAWDVSSKSASRTNVGEAGGSGPASGNRNRSYSRRAEMERVWEEDSDILPQHMAYWEDSNADYASNLKECPSSSTIRSWYDKSQQPLTISQQTSASAMAKGLPLKAQRLLDMDNSSCYTPPKSKKKPAKLDLSGNGPAPRNDGVLYDGPVLNDNHSPAPYSPATSLFAGKRQRRKIQKRPTNESHQKHDPMPSSYKSGAAAIQTLPQHTSMSELPNLYRNYEETACVEIGEDVISPKTKPTRVRISQSESNLRGFPQKVYPLQAPRRVNNDIPSPLSSHPTYPIPTHVIQAPTPTSVGPPSPLADCAASISSRHTQTSKASKRTNKSFQVADLQEQSVLLLSSDSEEEDEEEDYDTFNEPATRLTTSASTSRRPSESEIRHSMMVDAPLPSPGPVENGFDQSMSPKTISADRAIQAPPGFLTMSPDGPNPTSIMTPPQTQNNRQSQGSQLSRNPSLPSRIPTLPPWSPLRWTQEWPMKSGHESQPLQPPFEPLEQLNDPESSRRAYTDESSDATQRNVEQRKQSRQITPPLSPLSSISPSEDFCIDSARSHDAAADGDWKEQFVGLTRQEHMLIQALRQKRSLMRKQSIASSSDDSLVPLDRRGGSKHKANSSEITITPGTFQFDFPVPPVSFAPPEESTMSSTASTLELPRNFDGELSTDGALFMLSPPPSTHSARNSIVNTTSRGNSPNRQALSGASSQSATPRSTSAERPRKDKQIMLYLDQPGVPCMTITEGVMSPDTPGFDSNTTITYALSQQKKPQGSQKLPRTSSNRRKRDHAPERQPSTSSYRRSTINEAPPPIAEEEPIPFVPLLPPTRYKADNVPRDAPAPDTPSSPLETVLPDEFPAPPRRRRTVNNYNQSVRLSAVGPPQAMLGGPGWWGDED